MALRLEKLLRRLSKEFSTTVLTAELALEEAMAQDTTQLSGMVGELAAALGGIADMTQDDVKYVPLEDFISERLLADAQSDFDSSELVFEYEL